MAFKFVAILALLALASASTMDLNHRIQMTQQNQHQMNIEMQRQKTQYQEMMNQQHWEDSHRNHPHMQEYRDLHQMHFDRSHHHNIQALPNTFYHVYPMAVSHQHYSQIHRHGNPQNDYEFFYSVNDQSTGDHKMHQERRHGDRVEGQYSMLDADGFQRTVEYRADDLNGFQSEVHRTPVNTLTKHHIGHHSGAESYQYFNKVNSNNAMENVAVMTL